MRLVPPSDFPAIIDCSTDQRHAIGTTTHFLVGRSEDAHLSVANLRCSRKHFQIVFEGGRYFVEALVKENPTFLDGREVVGRAALKNGSMIRAGESDFRFLLAPAVEPAAPRPASAVPMAPKATPYAAAPPVTAPAAPAVALPRAAPTAPPIEEDGSRTVSASASQITELLALRNNIRLAGSMLIGREADAHIPLQHPQVSRRHAIIDRNADGRVALRDLSSANGTFVNGRRLTGKPVLLTPNDRINIGPYGLVFSGTELVAENRVSNIELISDNVTRIVTDRQTGKKLKLLDGVTLVFQPREFVCLLGPSGSGKSTLMTILSGRASPDKGTVLVNGKICTPTSTR